MSQKDGLELRAPKRMFCQHLKSSDLEFKWLAGDGSDRNYFRILDRKSQGTWLVMQLGQEDRISLKGGNYQWLDINQLLAHQGIGVPKIYQILDEFGEIIIEDCGDLLLENKILELCTQDSLREVEEVYSRVFELIGRMLRISKSSGSQWSKRAFTASKLESEMEFFFKYYMEIYRGIRFTPKESLVISAEIKSLCHFLAIRPQFFVHRDLHARNILIKNNKMIVIDFQDALLGPCAYDLVSLCYDSYVPLPKETRQNLIFEAIFNLSKTVGPVIGQEIALIEKPTLLHRQLKALGSFAYLSLVLKRGDYLRYRSQAIATLDQFYDKRWPFISNSVVALL